MTQIAGNPLDSSSIRFLPAGCEWDAIRVPRYLALAALKYLRSDPGWVLVVPHERALYFFVLPGSADRWKLPETRVFGTTQYVPIPPPHRNAPPGLYWLVHPRGGRALTDAEGLEDALRKVAAEQFGPREKVR